MNLRATSFSLLSTLVGNTQTKLTLRQYSLQCYLHCRLIYSIVLNVFISSDNQSQNMPILYLLVDMRRVERRSCQIISYTLYILVNVPMISQNIRFKPFQVRSKTFLRHSWLITPLGYILCLRALKTWLKIYRNPHDTKILRGLYSAFLIHFAGFW